MKKLILTLSSALVCLTMLFSMTACNLTFNFKLGNSKNKNNISETKQSYTEPDGTDSKTEAATEADLPNDNDDAQRFESFINSDAFQSQISSLKDAQSSTLDIDIYAEGTTIVYEYTYKKVYSEEVLPEMKTTLEQGLENMTSSFENIANTLKSAVNIDGITVKVMYYNGDGTEICSKEFYPTD